KRLPASRPLLAGRLNIPGAVARVVGRRSSREEHGEERRELAAMATEAQLSAEGVNAETLDATADDRPPMPLAAESPRRDPTDCVAISTPDRRVIPSTCGCGCA